MLILVVGPSRSGKSTLLWAVLPEFSTLTLLDLDAEENRATARRAAIGEELGGWDARWKRNRLLLEAAEVAPGNVIVDVGAGSLQTEDGRRFFVERGAQAIAVIAPYEAVLERHCGRDPEEFRRTEYSDERQRVYNAAKTHVDTNCGLESAIEEFRGAIRRLIEGAG